MSKKDEKNLKRIIISLIVLDLLILFNLFIINILIPNILFPAYMSTVIGCKSESSIALTPFESNSIAATTTSSSQGTQTVYNYTPNKLTMKHERIHIVQAKHYLLQPCKTNVILRYINEVEAYTFSHLPDKIFNIYYGKY